MSATPTVSEYVQKARDAIVAGNLDEAETLTKQAKALKALETEVQANRLDFGTPGAETPAVKTAEDTAIHAAYVKKYGDLDSGTAQIMKELYRTDNYPRLLAEKCRVVNFYCKTAQIIDPRLASMVLLTPEQIMSAIYGGVPVSDGNYSIKATMVEAQDTLGGVLVPEEINNDMIQRLPGLTVVRPRARKYNTTRDALSFIVRTGGNARYIGNIRSKQTSESPSAGSFNTNATWGKANIPVHVNLSKVPVSRSLLEDSGMDILREVIMPEVTVEAAIKEDEQFLVGTGADEPKGIMIGTAANATKGNDDITIQVTGNASALAFSAFTKGPYNLAGQYRAKRNPSVAWVFNGATAGLLADLQDNTGAYLWTEMHGNNAAGAPDTLRGWTVTESEALANVAANTFPAFFGDWTGYRIVDRIGMGIQRYDDSALADTDSVAFYCRRRYGGQCAEGWKFVVVKVST